MDDKEVIALYQKAINRIDDCIEFNFPEVERDIIIMILDKLSNDLLTLSRGE